MNEITTPYSFRCDLNQGPLEATLDKALMHQDALGDIFRASVWRGSAPVDLTGITARGYLYLAATQQTILLDGSVSGSVASVALTSSCYAVPGHAALVIQLQQGTVRHTVLKVNFVIDRTCTDTVIDPSNVLPTLPELLAQIAAMEQATAAAKTATQEAVQATEEAQAATQEMMTTSAPAIIPTATGEVVSVSDSANRPLAGLRLYGKTTQDGTPTPDAPVELVNVGAGGSIGMYARGKNLLDSSAWTSGELNGVTHTLNNDGSITLKGTHTSEVVSNLMGIRVALPNGTYCVSGGTTSSGCYLVIDHFRNGASEFVASPASITVDDATEYVLVYLQIAANATVNTTVYPRIERGATQTAYEPYKDGGSLTASTPNGLPGIPVTSGGNYTDGNGQQWLCDEIDFGRGVYVQRVKQYSIDNVQDVAVGTSSSGLPYADLMLGLGGHKIDGRLLCNCYAQILTGTPGTHGTIKIYDSALTVYDNRFTDKQTAIDLLTSMGFVAYVIKPTPVETALTADELTAYRAMTSQYPNTTVYNDAGAGMAVDYVADTETWCTKKFTAIAEALLNK